MSFDSPHLITRERGLLYRSTSRLTREAFDLATAVPAFAARNAALDITGYLHLEDGTFYQFLEGPAEHVEAVWTSIRRDPRHSAVTLLSDGEITSRRFPNWAMGYTTDEASSLFDWTARSGLPVRGRNIVPLIVAFLEYVAGSPAPA